MKTLLKRMRKWRWMNTLLRAPIRAMYRLSVRLVNKWPVQGDIRTQVSGIPLRMAISGDSATSNSLYYGHTRDEEFFCFDFFVEAARHADVHTVLDVGAHSGVYGLLGALAKPTNTAYIFEPFVNNAQVVARNIALNGLHKRAHLVKQVVGNEVGQVEFNVADDDEMLLVGSVNDWWTESFYQDQARKYKKLTLPQTSLDAFVAAQGLPRVDLVKIDVESYEYAVLQGMRELLKVCSPIMLCEVMPFAPDRQVLEDFLREHGYTFWTLGRGDMMQVNNLCGNVKEINFVLLRTGETLGVRHGYNHYHLRTPRFTELLTQALRPPADRG